MPVVRLDNAEHYRWGDGCDGWHLLKSPGLSVIQECIPPGKSEVRHYHERAAQFFFVLEGQATIELEDRRHIVSPREGIAVPPGTAHQLRNDSKSDLRFLVISAPMSHGDRVAAP